MESGEYYLNKDIHTENNLEKSANEIQFKEPRLKKPKKKYICYWDINSKNTLTNDYELIDKVYYLYRIASYGIGTPKFSRRQNKLLIKPFVLNTYDSLYLYDK